jgi:CheY-like chemotaxis protein
MRRALKPRFQPRFIMPRILIIDDDDGLRHMLVLMLERSGYEVVDAGDGREGLAKLQQQSFDLVVTDLIMPEQEGLETIMSIRRDYPSMKIVAMSGGSRMSPFDFLPAAKGLGAAATLKKPFGRDEFLATVKQLAGEAAAGSKGK